MISRIFLILLLISSPLAYANADTSQPTLPENDDPSDTLQILLNVPEAEIDLTWSKLVIDELIDQNANLENDLKDVEAIAAKIMSHAGEGSDASTRVELLRSYIYKSGSWNAFKPYSYDFDDPMGLSASHKSLNHYLTTRKGNCINMPFLFLAVAERMGVEMNVTTAPRHVFIQFDNPQTGKVEHLEATSGAQPQRIVWQRQVMPITDRSLESGMYHQRLNKRQQVAVMGEALMHKAYEDGDHSERLEIATLILDVFPQADAALLHSMGAFRDMIREQIAPLYAHPSEMPPQVFAQFEKWAMAHDAHEAKLLDYGWQPAKPNPNVVMPNARNR
jgi:regulator of sirC expression with transglutaminase-like and TPR domain